MRTILRAVAVGAITLLQTSSFAGLVTRFDPPAKTLALAFASSPGPEGGPDCRNAADRVDGLEESILDLKARYWAIQFRNGIALDNLVSNPGDVIVDRGLRARFFARLRSYYSSKARISALSADEVRQFVAIDGAAFSLHAACGL